MKPIPYLERQSGELSEEKVYGGKALSFLYGDALFAEWIGAPLRHFFARFPFVSSFMGWWNKLPISKKRIAPFIAEYGVDSAEFLEPIEHFQSFNDFFIRRLKKEARPIDQNPKGAVIPADARYWFFENVDLATPFEVKNQPFDLEKLFKNQMLAKRYAGGSLALGRLCPSDYHRFHFPCDCIPQKAHLINGPLYSVNPIALKQNLSILSENKRMVTLLDTELFGQIAYIEVGATAVGTIVETFVPGEMAAKGSEKGYFSFGGSSLVLLFEKGKFQFSPDLLAASQKNVEVRCLLGQPMGQACSSRVQPKAR